MRHFRSTRRLWSPLAVLVAGLFVGTSTVRAQTGLTGAAIAGTVRDATEALLPKTAITVTEASTNLTRTTTTDDRGRYLLAALPLGSYLLRAEHPGFQMVKREGVSPAVGQVLVVNLTLSVAATETVSVEAEETASSLAGAAAVASVVGARALEGLPTNGRDFVAFTLLTPGVVAERTPPSGLAVSSGLSFAGQRARSNNVMVDGFDNNHLGTGAVAAPFSQDAVREFQVLAASFPAEFGDASGGIVNTVTKSGTNELRGSAFFFLRDHALNAKGHFEKNDVYGNAIDAPKGPFHQAQWGAILGGPLRKDRTFFFLSYEQFDAAASNFVNMDAGVAAALVRNGFPVELGSVPYEVATRSALAKLDHNFGPTHRLLVRGHFSRGTDESVEPFGGIVARSHGQVLRQTDLGIAASLTDVFASGFVNEARVQVVSRDRKINGLDPTCGGPCVNADQGGPEILLPGLALAGRHLTSPAQGSNFNIELGETVTRAAGRHTVKAGFGLRFIERKAATSLDMGGRYVFAALLAIPGLTPRALTSLEAFELGLPALYFQGYGDPASSGSTRMASLFAQDRWQVTTRLTLEAGVRYQGYALGTPPQTVSDLGGTTLTYDVPDGGDLAPRLAAAFDPSGSGRTMLHAAFGIFHDYPMLVIPIVTEIHDGVELLQLRASLPLSAQAWRSPGRRLPQPLSFPSQVQTGGPGFRVPFARTLSLGLDQELRPGLKLAVDLLAVRGKRQIGPIDFNPLVPALGPGRRPNDVGGIAGTSATITQLTNYGENWYRGITVSVHGRSARWEAQASYTLSKAEDLGNDIIFATNVAEDPGLGRDPADPGGLPLGFDPQAFRGPAVVDQRHRFVASAVAELPWRLRLSGIVTLASGRPYTALAGVDFNGDGLPATDRARGVATDPASRVGRNHGLTPGFASVDIRLAHRIDMPRHMALELLAEAFNLLNRANFSDVNNTFGPGAFPSAPQLDPQGRASYGRATKAYAPRQVQLAARLSF